MRIRRERGEAGRDGETEFVEIDTTELSGVFAAPAWLRDLGVMSWLLVGITALIAGLVWLLSLTQTIVIPVITASILAAVLAPLVALLKRHGVPRGAGAAIVLLMIVAAGVLIAVLILHGISAQSGQLNSQLQGAANTIEGWLKDLGVDSQTVSNAKSDASGSLSSAFHALISGLGTGISALGSLAVFLSFTVLSLFFLLKDGPSIRTWLERHMGVPRPVARTISARVIGSMRGYFAGVTAVAAFNGILIGLGAWILGVPLAGSIAVVNFVAAYIPYLGAWTAGAFTVLLTLSAEGTSTALIMMVIVFLANGALQQLIQPIAYGATLGIHPLAVLIVTIAGGALFGTIGLVVAAPLTAAVSKISTDLARARATGAGEAAGAAPPAATPPPPAPTPS